MDPQPRPNIEVTSHLDLFFRQYKVLAQKEMAEAAYNQGSSAASSRVVSHR
jgi:hypothetical protein